MTSQFPPDPSPDEDLPSDETFTMWLESLDPDTVKLDLELGLSRYEREGFKAIRKRISLRHPQEKNPREETQ